MDTPDENVDFMGGQRELTHTLNSATLPDLPCSSECVRLKTLKSQGRQLVEAHVSGDSVIM